jgi:putative ATP-dependent endonuclease of the OLD family
MKLKKLTIKNLRGLREIEFDNHSLTTLIGKNNCGKSSVLRAIELLCTGVKPELEEFYLRGVDSIEIVGVFDELQEWERNSPAISGLIYNNQLNLKYTASIEEEEGEKKPVQVNYTAMKQQETIGGWADTFTELPDDLKAIATGIDITNQTKFKTKASQERLRQKIREDHPEKIQLGEAEWSDESISIKNALQQAIPKIIIIPAVKDAADESKYSKGGKSAFGELMKRLILPQIQAVEEYAKIIAAIDALSAKIHSEEGIDGIKQINTSLSQKLSRLINAKANVKFENPEIDTIISSSVGLRLADGAHETPIGLQGHGLQRTLIFSLLEMVAENEAAITEENIRSTIILFEEPELYLHPQMLRKLKSVLNTISQSENWQVITSTHSPVFINVADAPQSLVILSRTHGGEISVRQLSASPFEDSEDGNIERDALRAALDFHPTVCEVFFADKVVLVEGDTEMAIFKHCDPLLQHCNVDLHRSLDCTIVSCGGKWTIPAIARLLRSFGIGFKVVHDLDRHQKTDAELAALLAFHPYRANARIALVTAAENIFICDDTLEDLWNGNKSDKPYSAIQKNIEMVNANEVPPRVIELVQFVYAGFLH